MENKEMLSDFIWYLVRMNNKKLMGYKKDEVIEYIKNSGISKSHKIGLIQALKSESDSKKGIDTALTNYYEDVVRTWRGGNIEKVAMFEKVSYEQFKKDMLKVNDGMFKDLPDEKIKDIYDGIKLPERATEGSAGYDFFIPFSITLSSVDFDDSSIVVPTGIRCSIRNGWVLMLYPRSGLGFKYRIQLDNTVGVIDSDYYDSDNEGHIMVKVTNDSKIERVVDILRSNGFVQGIFMPFGVTVDDNVIAKRNGGFGSTDK